MVVPGRPYVLLQFFILLYFFQREISEVPWPTATKFCHVVRSMFNFIISVQKFCGPLPKKLGAKNMLNLAQFQTSSQFDHEYLWSGSRYRQSETKLIDSYPFQTEQIKLVNFHPLTVRLCWPMCTHPKLTACTILDNFRLWPRISAKWIKISTAGNKFD